MPRLRRELVRAEQVNVQTRGGVCRVCVTTDAWLTVQSEEMDKLCCLIEPAGDQYSLGYRGEACLCLLSTD